ncbi:MAG: toxin-antitoxin system YwqK family antitoxin [Bacteroidota bacterium]
MKLFRSGIFFLLLISANILFAQEGTLSDGITVFYHPNGEKSSEGYIKDGKPEGYWKTYNEEGILLSEGNRKNHLLDSTWKFYDAAGSLKMEINYKTGKKNGLRITYRENERLEENFIDDLKQGISSYYYPGGELKKTVFFIDGLEEGIAKEYAEDGRITQLITYKKGFIANRERINRYDNGGKKHGNWKYFYDNANLKIECVYKHGLQNGYYKEYDVEGNLLHAFKYVDGEKQEFAAELIKLDVKKEYFADGKVKIQATYKDDKPEGVWREYNEEGDIESSYLYKNGIIVGEGIITEQGERDGAWKEYYDDGIIKGEGSYDHDTKTGPWTYYHRNGELEQTGTYDTLGRLKDSWKWFYSSGQLQRKENYKNGLADGLMSEYDEAGKLIIEGTYYRGKEDGSWFYEVGDHKEEGEYIEGMRDGAWRSYYRNGDLKFKGKFIEDNPHGEHIWLWDNGKTRDKGSYIMGRKHGDWVTYNYDGTPFLVITYENGVEKKYDGVKILREYTVEDIE